MIMGAEIIDRVARERGSTPQPPSEYLAECGRRGGDTTLARYGKDHYRRLGQRSAAKRKQRHEDDHT